MSDEAYIKQRQEGAKQMVERLRAFGKDLGVEISACVWNKGESLEGRNSHQLEARAGANAITATFSDEQLADYPGKAGTAKSDAMLREMAQRLRQ